MGIDPSQLNPAWRRIEAINPDWYQQFDRDDPYCVVGAVADLATLDANGWGVYVAPDAVGTQWVRLYYPHTEDGPGVNPLTGDYNLDAAATRGGIYCERLHGFLHGMQGRVRVVWGPLPATGNINDRTFRKYAAHRAVCDNPARHDEVMRTIIDLEYVDAQRVICHAAVRTMTADDATEAIAGGIRHALLDAAHEDRRDCVHTALNLEMVAASVSWSPWRIDAVDGAVAWGPERRTPNPPRGRFSFVPMDYWKWVDTQLLSTHCHALADSPKAAGATLPNFVVVPRRGYADNACRFVSAPDVVHSVDDNHWKLHAGTRPMKIGGIAFGARDDVVRAAFALLSKHKEGNNA